MTMQNYFTRRRARSQSMPAPNRPSPADRDAPLISGTATGGLLIMAPSGTANVTTATATTNTPTLTRLKSLRITPQSEVYCPLQHSNTYAAPILGAN